MTLAGPDGRPIASIKPVDEDLAEQYRGRVVKLGDSVHLCDGDSCGLGLVSHTYDLTVTGGVQRCALHVFQPNGVSILEAVDYVATPQLATGLGWHWAALCPWGR